METRAQKKIRLEEEQQETKQNKKTKEEIETIINEIKMDDPEIISELEDISRNLQYEKNNKEFKQMEMHYGSGCNIM
jgi:Txe/YoeB family toxin of Txe-Axe toxin-antitoxin module